MTNRYDTGLDRGDSTDTTNNTYRILIVDDSPAIHEDFARILMRSSGAQQASRDEQGSDELGLSLLSGEPGATSPVRFELDSVYETDAALEAVAHAMREKAAYALVFMDVSISSGGNGIETTARMLRTDEFVHVVLCTADEDPEWREPMELLSHGDRVLFLKKPLDTLEVRQLAHAICTKWKLARLDKKRLEDLERSVNDKSLELEEANRHLRKEIAERKQAERELDKAQRLEGLGRLAAGLCHEINNPLSFIISSIEAMEDTLEQVKENLSKLDQEEMQELLRAASVGADRITQVVRSVKLFARQSDTEAEFVDVKEVIELTASLAQKNFEPHVELTLDFTDTPLVLGRRIELEQVFTNLLDNAGQALSEQTHRPARIRVTLAPDGPNHVIAQVSDSGPGIEDSVIDKIFDPFFTTKPVNQGTGLGLSICHSLIRGMNGTIAVKSTLGQGTEFTIRLPAVPVSAPPLPPIAESGRPSPIRPDGDFRGRVLVLDDEPFILRILQRVLHNHDVTTVSNAHEALSLCMKETYHVIFSDIMMPGVNGRDFYRMLARARPGEEQKIVFITGGTLIQEVREFLDSVPNQCLEKPVDARTLNQLIGERVRQLSPDTGGE